jgi:hypothetical protein
MPSSKMLRRVALVRTDVSEEPSASIIRVTILHRVRRLLVTANVVPSSPIFVALIMSEGCRVVSAADPLRSLISVL